MDPSESNQKLIFWIATTATTILLGIGTAFYTGIQNQFDAQQSRISDNSSKIWEQQQKAVTEDTLTRRLADVMQVVDTKIDGIKVLQQEQYKQLAEMMKSQKEFQSDVRNILREKADKE